ncbi:hypothetical protein N665_0217s0002 [Sinapis alba]|nr:hypothetical protein N665_0217s0002 [Sinapis alba]
MGKALLIKERGGIGFRMIYEFNLALLAKQLWKLVQYPDSLLGRVLPGNYYMHSLPLGLSTIDNPSYVWTSISAARQLLLLGIRQKIHSSFVTKCPVVHPEVTVSDFTGADTKVCDVETLDNLVIPEDVPLIRSFTISRTSQRHTYYWSYTKTGQYTVKSGYGDALYSEPNITKFQNFACKVNSQ